MGESEIYVNKTSYIPNSMQYSDSAFFKFDKNKKNSIKSMISMEKQNWKEIHLKLYHNLSEYTDENILSYIIEPHKSQIKLIKEKVKIKRNRIF